MAEKIIIADFNIDVEQLTAAAAETAKAIQTIKNEQSELTKQGKNTDEAFIRNAVNLRGLQKDYNAQLRVLDQYMTKTNAQVGIQQRIDIALNREVKTVQDLREQNQEFIKIRNQVNIETEEGQKQIALLNSQIDANTTAIKENVSGMEQQKMGIGGYTDAIKDALGGTDLFNGALGNMEGLLKSSQTIFQGISTELKDVAASFKTATAGTQGMTVAQKASTVATNLTTASLKLLRVALISTGIGAIVVLLGSLVAYLTSSEQASNRFSKILKTVGGVVRELIRYLEPLGELLMDGIEAGFRAVGAIAEKVFKVLSSGLEMLGFDNAAKGVDNFANSMRKGAQMAELIADKEEKFTESNRKANQVMLEYQKEAEKLRQIRDNENLTIAERTAANEKLGQTLKEQLAVEKQIAIQALEIANLRIAQEGRTAAALDAQAEAMTRVSDIQERIIGQESEQLTNRVSLQKEAADRAKEAADRAKEQAQNRINQMNDEIDLFIAQQGVRARSLDEQLKLEEEIAAKRKNVLDQELKNKLISQTQYNTAVLELDNSLAETRANLAISNLDRELKLNENRIQTELNLSKAIGEAKLQEELRYNEQLKAIRSQYEADRFEQGLISEQEYRDNILEIDKEFLVSQNDIIAANDELLKEKKAEQQELDLQMAMIAAEELNKNVFDIQSLQIEQQRQRDLEAARQKYTDGAMLQQALLNINRQANLAQEKLEIEKNNAIWQSRADLAGAIAQLFGEETLAGKAAAIAQATINTYLGATASLKLGWPIGPIAAAATIAQGLGTVAKISGISGKSKGINIPQKNEATAEDPQAITLNAVAPFATGGLVTGGLPIKRSNGDNVLATLKTGEVVLNERQQMALGGSAIFKAIGVPGFATGGLVSNGSNPTIQSSLLRNNDALIAKSIGEAVKNGAMIGTEIGARQGIVDVSTESYLSRLATN